MQRCPGIAAALAAVVLLLASGCTSPGTTRDSAVDSAQIIAIDDGPSPLSETDSPADVTSQRIESVGDPAFTLRYPEVQDAAGFNHQMSEFIEQLRDTHMLNSDAAGTGKPGASDPAETDAPTPGASSEPAASQTPTETAEYRLDWEVARNSKHYISFLLRDESTLPDAAPGAFYSMILNRDTGDEIRSMELFTDEGREAMAAAALDALKTQGSPTHPAEAAELSSEQIDAVMDGATVDSAGDLVAYLGSGVLNSDSDDPVAISFPAEDARGWLTSAGQDWLDDSEAGPRLGAGEPVPEKTTRERNVDCATTKCVALTYDDGPSDHTAQLLDTLEEKAVPATFFILGQNIAGREDILKRVADEGHEVGSHTWNHPQLTKVSHERAEREHERVNSEIEKVTGEKPTVFRPPYGDFARGIPDGGLPAIIWSVDSNDWRHQDDPQATVDAATADVRPGDIILMHDKHAGTVDAAPEIIDRLQADGFTLVTVSELFGGDLQADHSYYSDERMEGSRHIPPWAG